jgi:hypothetical protein
MKRPSPTSLSKTCEICKKVYFNIHHEPSDRFLKRSRFCSKSCLGKWNAAHQGKKGAFPKGHIPWIKGRKMPWEFKRKYLNGIPIEVLREWRRKAQINYKKKNRHKIKAREFLNKGIRDGIVQRLPCQICGNPKSESHHYLGYNKEHWLDIKWYCHKCHGQIHKNQNRNLSNS